MLTTIPYGTNDSPPDDLYFTAIESSETFITLNPVLNSMPSLCNFVSANTAILWSNLVKKRNALKLHKCGSCLHSFLHNKYQDARKTQLSNLQIEISTENYPPKRKTTSICSRAGWVGEPHCGRPRISKLCSAYACRYDLGTQGQTTLKNTFINSIK